MSNPMTPDPVEIPPVPDDVELDEPGPESETPAPPMPTLPEHRGNR